MNKNLIVIEGTDCSGKETQTKLLIQYFEKKGRKVCFFSFPDYNTPTGKILGGPYLGKDYICKGWFPEGAPNVDAKVASLYYAADRYYQLNKINEKLENGYIVLLDRYTYSNMAHQGGKLEDQKARLNLYEWIQKLEFEMLGLPIPGIRIFLHMPTQATSILKKDRLENMDQHEKDINHLSHAENAYLEISKMFHFKTIECTKKMKDITLNDIKTPEEIHLEIIKKIIENEK